MTIEKRLENLENELIRAKHLNRIFLSIFGLVFIAIGIYLGLFCGNTVQAQRHTGFGLTPEQVNQSRENALKEAEFISRLNKVNSTVIHATSFVLDGENGKACAALENINGNPYLAFTDMNGKIRLQTGISNDMPYLNMLNKDGKQQIHISISDNVPNITVCDEKGVFRATMAYYETKPRLTFFSETGKILADIDINELSNHSKENDDMERE